MRKSPTVDRDIRTPGGSTEATTPSTASTTRQYWQDLQRKQQQQRNPAITTSVSRDESWPSRMSSTAKSFRFEELYQDGLRKARQRPATEKVS